LDDHDYGRRIHYHETGCLEITTSTRGDGLGDEEERNTGRYTSKNDALSAEQVDHHIGGKATFYFTNIPENMPVFRLRQFFEVFGILSDVYVSRHLNARGQVYGFVRFLNVKSRDILRKALNNIWIGDWRVWAKEARFDRFAQFDEIPRAVRSGSRSEGKDMEVKSLVITHGVGVKNVRLGPVKADDRAYEGEKIVKVGMMDVNVGLSKKKNKSKKKEG